MTAIKCEMCNSTDIIKENGIFKCQHCGTKYTTEETRKLIVEIDSPIKIAGISNIDTLLNNANTFLKLQEWNEARKCYKEITAKYPDDVRGWWGTVKYALTVNPYSIAGSEYQNALKNAILLSEGNQDFYYNQINNTLYNYIPEQVVYDGWPLRGRTSEDFVIGWAKVKDISFFSEGLKNAEKVNKYKIEDICRVIECDALQKYYDSHNKEQYTLSSFRFINGYTVILCYSTCAKAYIGDTPYGECFIVYPLKKKICGDFDKLIAEANLSEKKGCYIATSIYGSYDCPQVWVLRRFRDNKLSKSWYGRAFIRLYYAVSPKLVMRYGQSKWFRKICKSKLDALVKRFHNQGIADTYYEDK